MVVLPSTGWSVEHPNVLSYAHKRHKDTRKTGQVEIKNDFFFLNSKAEDEDGSFLTEDFGPGKGRKQLWLAAQSFVKLPEVLVKLPEVAVPLPHCYL